MRILVASDLHYGVSRTGDAAVRALAAEVVTRGADVLLLGGDLATGPRTLDALLTLFSGFEGARLAVPGNHDVWVQGWGALDSWEIHEKALPEMFAKHRVHPLHLAPIRVGDVAFVGSMGWYDYSFRDEIGIDIDAYAARIYPGKPRVQWGDRVYAKFPQSDPDLTAILVERLRDHIGQIERASMALPIVGLVHHLVHRDLRPAHHFRSLIPTHWRFLNAFLGSDALGEPLLASKTVTQVFCGHVHRAKTLVRAGKRLTTVGGDYKQKQLIETTDTTILSRRLYRGPSGLDDGSIGTLDRGSASDLGDRSASDLLPRRSSSPEKLRPAPRRSASRHVRGMPIHSWTTETYALRRRSGTVTAEGPRSSRRTRDRRDRRWRRGKVRSGTFRRGKARGVRRRSHAPPRLTLGADAASPPPRRPRS